jgi:hypothetical protein
MTVQEERNRFTKILIARQEECQNKNPEDCDVCHMLELLIDEVNS